MNPNPTPVILMADDDLDDRLLMQEALEENKLQHSLHFVEDGIELLNYLRKKGRFLQEQSPRPNLILLDLNMPKMDGRQALAHVKADADLKNIPVVIFTTSTAKEDILKTYNLGANSFICKPAEFKEMVEIARAITTYWFGTVALP